ncbi:IF2 family translation initiation factor [Mycobacterium yunnanensis]|uniref:IF2 family translation initiation factor n=1 Tax=Mycobacterium yunnanensis TaxID=368477 RepID=A0A9X2YZD1_9MYCO|nr:IF2 family translation initiation factor [Mycobacterium yunnanensis]MCV7420345.1 IF2 family translation initiation factor [Mycobacterium yunnanensis]
MSIVTIPRTILRLQYQLVRLPLQLIEERVVSRLDAEAPARLVYERSLGVLDATVGNALGDARLKRTGASLAKRSDELARAARLEDAANEELRRAEADLRASRENVVDEVRDARAQREQSVDEAAAAAEKRTRAAADAAQRRAGATKKEADDIAARLTKQAEAAKRADEQRIESVEKRVTAAAEDTLDDARQKQDAARAKRADADRLEELADTEKEKRRAERSTDS